MEYGPSLGSNLDDTIQHLRDARHALAQHPAVHITAASHLYETEPVDVQPAYAHLAFVNAVLIVESSLEAQCLLAAINDIETQLGRVREEDRNAPRTIDIDILYAGDQLIESGGLTVPHPRWAERAFVVVPLAEVRPDLTLPGTNTSVAEHLMTLEDRSGASQLEADRS